MGFAEQNEMGAFGVMGMEARVKWGLREDEGESRTCRGIAVQSVDCRVSQETRKGAW